MASEITIRARTSDDERNVRVHLDEALRVFNAVKTARTRFDPASPLMRANARTEHWMRVGRVYFNALVEAHRAYRETAGRFDPRVFGDLLALGYNRSLPFAEGNVQLAAAPPSDRPPLAPWRAGFRKTAEEVMLGTHPVDLGGIAKGLAVRWAGQVLLAACDDYLVEAGGDYYCAPGRPLAEGRGGSPSKTQPEALSR